MTRGGRSPWLVLFLPIGLCLVLVLLGIGLVLQRGTVPEKAQPLRLGLILWPPYDFAYLAAERGLLKSSDVRIIDYPAPADAMRDYRNGVIDVIALTGDFLIDAAVRDPERHRVIMAIDFSRGGDAILARPGIGSVADLRGRRVGVEASSLGLYVLERALDLNGLGKDAVTIVPIDLPNQVTAYDEGRVDAVVTFEPVNSLLLARGAHIVFDSRSLPAEITDVLFTSEATIATKAPQLRLLVNAWMKALDSYRSDPDAVRIMAEREHLEPAAFVKALSGAELLDRRANEALLTRRDPRLALALERVQDYMLSKGMIPTKTNVAALLEPKILLGRLP